MSQMRLVTEPPGRARRICTLLIALLFTTLPLMLLITSAKGQTEENEKSGEPDMTELFEGNTNAPDFPTELEWLNTEKPLSIKDLEGKIVLLDFWTFCCINCLHIIPDLKKLEAKYPEELVVIGVHSAKFSNEQDTEAIRQAILRYEIEHPVINDKDFIVWRQYGARAWPTLVLINPKGRIMGGHSGEGIFDLFDAIIGDAVKYFDAKGELKRSPLNLTLEKEKASKTLLSFPGKVKADPENNRLFITDTNHNRIIITDPDGAIQDIIGAGSIGMEDGAFETATFNHPQGTVLDGDILYIADTENHLIRTADLEEREVKTILGTGEQARRPNVKGTGTEVALNSPWDVLAHDGKLYIAMAGPHQLWSADLATFEARPHAGSGREARIDAPLLEAALAQPSGITTDGGKLYFADSETSSIRSADIALDGKVDTIIGDDLFEFGDQDGNADVARLQHALGVVYKDNLLYVADTYNSKIKIIDPVKRTSTTYAGTGADGFQDGERLTANFNEPSGLTILGDALYIADTNNHQIRIIDMQANTVRTMAFTNIAGLGRRTMKHFTGRIVELEEQHIKAGTGTIALTFNLPKGYKFTDGAPFYMEWASSQEGNVKFTTTPDKLALNPEASPVEVPVQTTIGISEVTFDTVVYFCQDEGGACLVDDLRIRIPIQVTETAPATLSLSVNVGQE